MSDFSGVTTEFHTRAQLVHQQGFETWTIVRGSRKRRKEESLGPYPNLLELMTVCQTCKESVTNPEEQPFKNFL